MIALVLSCLVLSGDPAASAGTEYLKGLKALEESRLSDALQAFEEAIRHQAAESSGLKYRTTAGRYRHAYYPHFEIARVLGMQARAETQLVARKSLMEQAIRRLNQTRHPEGPGVLAEMERALAESSKAIAEEERTQLPPAIKAVRTKVDRLIQDEERFEDALKEVQASGEAFARREKLQQDMVAMIRDQQQRAIKRYQDILLLRLDSVSQTDPTLEAERILPLLRPGVVPPHVHADPGPQFAWVSRFWSTYEKEIDRVKGALSIPLPELMASADRFDALASQALDQGYFDAFKASRHMAHSLRMTRLKALAKSPNPASTEFRKDVATLTSASEQMRGGVEAEIGRRLTGAAGEASDKLKKYLEELAYQKRQVEESRERIDESIVAYERMVAADARTRKAEESLFAPEVMAGPAECRKVGQELTALEEEAHFETLPAAIRARVFLARAIAVGMATFLDGEQKRTVLSNCSGDVNRAFQADGKVILPWKEKGLSPRLVALVEEIRRR